MSFQRERYEMKRVAAVGLVVAFLTGVNAPQAGEAEDELQGSWTLESKIASGKEFTQARAYNFQLRVEGRKWTVFIKGKAANESELMLDASKDPRWLDVTFQPRGGKALLSRGIYKVEGDTLTVAQGTAASGKRPNTFESPNGSDVVLSVYKRDKK
jgi:uncharacterized protein (TIGR03067 family)